MAKLKGIPAMRKSILDNRARLILGEKPLEEVVAREQPALLNRWESEIRALVRKRQGKITAAELQQALRGAAALRKTGKVTDVFVKAVEKNLKGRLQGVYNREAVRVTHAIEPGRKVKLGGAVGAKFGEANLAAVIAAGRSTIPGLAIFKEFKNLPAATLRQMKKDLARAVAEGKGVDWLTQRWARGQGAGRVLIEARALARTAYMAASNEAQLAVYRAEGIVKKVRWTAAFDIRVCQYCGALDGTEYDLDNAPPLPAHPNCRCVWMPVFGLAAPDKLLAPHPVPPPGAVAKIDNEFGAWLANQPEWRQRAFFGSELKYLAFRDGELTLAQMVRLDGSTLSDAEIAKLVDPAWLQKIQAPPPKPAPRPVQPRPPVRPPPPPPPAPVPAPKPPQPVPAGPAQTAGGQMLLPAMSRVPFLPQAPLPPMPAPRPAAPPVIQPLLPFGEGAKAPGQQPAPLNDTLVGYTSPPAATTIPDITRLRTEPVVHYKLGGSESGVNAMYYAGFPNGDKAVYKPIRGEHKSVAIEQIGVAGRSHFNEEAAYAVDDHFHVGLVPPTTIRIGKDGIGSWMGFVPDAARAGVFSEARNMGSKVDPNAPGTKVENLKLAVFDAVIGNNDRHGGNVMVDSTNKLYAIDNGFTFTAKPPKRLRNTQWTTLYNSIKYGASSHDSLPVEVEDLIKNLTDENELRKVLKDRLTSKQLAEVFKRASALRAHFETEGYDNNAFIQFVNEWRDIYDQYNPPP